MFYRPPPTGGRPNYGGNTSPPSFGSRYSSGVSSLYNSPVAMLPIAGEVVSALHAVNCVVRVSLIIISNHLVNKKITNEN